MSIKQATELTMARLDGASGLPSPATRRGANGAEKANPGAAFTWAWYRHPERLMSQGERLPS